MPTRSLPFTAFSVNFSSFVAKERNMLIKTAAQLPIKAWGFFRFPKFTSSS